MLGGIAVLLWAFLRGQRGGASRGGSFSRGEAWKSVRTDEEEAVDDPPFAGFITLGRQSDEHEEPMPLVVRRMETESEI